MRVSRVRVVQHLLHWRNTTFQTAAFGRRGITGELEHHAVCSTSIARSSRTPFLRTFAVDGYHGNEDEYHTDESSEPHSDTERFRKLWQKIAKAVPERKYDAHKIVKEWMAEGNSISRETLYTLISRLRRRRRFTQALQISEWMVDKKPVEIIDADRITRLDLTARAGRLDDAERIFQELPPQHKTEITHTILLTGYASRNLEEKAEEMLKQLKELKLITTPHPYNNMLLMYKRRGLEDKMRAMYDELEASGVAPDALTYLVLLRNRGHVGGIEGVEEKAAKTLKRILKENKELRWSTYEVMIRVYGYLCDLDGVERMWSILQTNPAISNTSYLCAMDAFGLAGAVNRAEDVFNAMEQSNRLVPTRQYSVMINVYARDGQTDKAEMMLKRLSEANRKPTGPLTYHPLIVAYIKNNEMDKALSVFEEAMKSIRGPQTKVMYPLVLTVLELYAEKGDVEAAERLVEQCKKANYPADVRLYNGLLRVYLNAQQPLYGIEERMKYRSLTPNEETKTILKEMATASSIRSGDCRRGYCTYRPNLMSTNRFTSIRTYYSQNSAPAAVLFNQSRRSYSSHVEVNNDEEEFEFPLYTENEKIESTAVELVKLILASRQKSVRTAKEWQAEGNEVSGPLMEMVIAKLVRKCLSRIALEIYDWVVDEKLIEMNARSKYLHFVVACQANLKRMNELFDGFEDDERTEKVYSNLVIAYASRNKIEEAETAFKELMDRYKPTTPLVFNHMMLMYILMRQCDKAVEMYSYMKYLGVEANILTYHTLLRIEEHLGGFKEEVRSKSKMKLNSMDVTKLTRHSKEKMLSMYGYVGDGDGVQKMWDLLKSYDHREYHTEKIGIQAFEMVGKEEKVERIFEESKEPKKLYHHMIRFYALHGNLEKAKQLLLTDVELKGHSQFKYVIDGYLKVNKIDEAYEILKLAMEMSHDYRAAEFYPIIVSVMSGFVEKKMIKQAKELINVCIEKQCARNAKVFNEFLKVYCNAKIPVTGVRRKMKHVYVRGDDETRLLLEKLKTLDTSSSCSISLMS